MDAGSADAGGQDAAEPEPEPSASYTLVAGYPGVGAMALRSLFAASNGTPEDDSLNALYDRFLLRVVVPPLAADDSPKVGCIHRCAANLGQPWCMLAVQHP